MTIDERIEALTMNLELTSRQQETHSQQIGMLITAGEKAGERIEAVTMNLELVTRDIETLRDLAAKDGENIRGLARIAELQHLRLTKLEEG